MACHTDSLKKYFTLLNNLNEFKKFSNDISIINSIDSKYSKNLKDDLSEFEYIKNYFEINNDKFLDFGKWIYALGKINFKAYDYILFTNDSILIIEKLDNFFHYLENLNENINVYGYNDSSQLGIYHYQSYLFLIRSRIINKFINHFHSRKHLIHNQESLVKHMELNLTKIDSAHDCFLKLAGEWNSNKNIFWENDQLYEHMIIKNIFHLFKLKKIRDYISFYKHDIERFADHFDCNYYRQTYKDLSTLNDTELFDHYKGFGFKEGRSCNSQFFNLLPKIYKDKLEERKLNYLFNVPHNFDIYYYKNFNKSLKNYSPNQIINHYLEHGKENEDVILMNNYNDNHYKNKVFEYYSKLYYNINVELPETFNYNKLLRFNKDFKNSGILKNIIQFYYRKDLIPNINLDDYNMELEWIKRLHPEFGKSTKEELYTFFYQNMKEKKFKNLDDKFIDYYKENYNLLPYDTEYIKHHFKFKECLVKNNIFNNFNGRHYKLLNRRIPGIKNFTDEQAQIHYFTTGYKENLPYKLPEDFNPIFYKYLYFEEFKNMSLTTLTEHYLSYGHHEKRNYKLPYYFRLKIFKELYNKNDSDENLYKDYILHYLKKKITKDQFINYYKNKETIIDELDLIPEDFDIRMYKILNDDLKKLSNHKIKIHFIEYGYDEGRLYKMPKKFNLEMYKLFNSDLKDLSDDEIYIHYIEFGEKEKRICNIPEDFRVKNYKKLNPDLSKLNQEQLLEHYLSLGIKENRPYYIPKEFKPSVYKKLYKDLKDLSDDQLIMHYSKQGVIENRIYKLPSKFNADNYRKFYKDLSNLSDEDALYHYVSIGMKENRIYELPKDFDLKNYRNLHFDLTFMNDNEVLEHFIYHGIQEKRQYKGYNKFHKKDTVIKKEESIPVKKNDNYKKLPEDFSITGYKLFNPDLFYYDNEEFLVNHYLEKGINENRLYKMPDNFDADMYKKLNPDIEDMSKARLIEHFKISGIKENRLYEFPKDFDFNFYKNAYLNNDNSYNDEKIKEYYLEKGIKKKHWIKLPSDFNLKIYRKLNQDLDNLNDDEIIKQYVKVGHKTRIYK